MLNNCVFVGRTTKDVEARYTASDNPMAIASFTIAVDKGFGDKKKTNFIPVTAFGKTAEFLERNLLKGKLVAVQGEYNTGSYEKDGKKVYTTNINANDVKILEWGDKQDKPSGFDTPSGFTELPDDFSDVPF